MRAKKPNRKYSFETMRSRIQNAKSEAELEALSDLLDDMCNANLLTASKYRDLDCMLNERLGQLVREGKI